MRNVFFTFKIFSQIVKAGGKIRLVKGAYRENSTVGYPKRAESTANYVKIMQYLFENSSEFTLGTHDDNMIKEAMALQKKYKRKITFAMLKGVRRNLASEISKKYNMEIYVPFGESWVDYSFRRLKEMENSFLILRSIFQQ